MSDLKTILTEMQEWTLRKLERDIVTPYRKGKITENPDAFYDLKLKDALSISKHMPTRHIPIGIVLSFDADNLLTCSDKEGHRILELPMSFTAKALKTADNPDDLDAAAYEISQTLLLFYPEAVRFVFGIPQDVTLRSLVKSIRTHLHSAYGSMQTRSCQMPGVFEPRLSENKIHSDAMHLAREDYHLYTAGVVFSNVEVAAATYLDVGCKTSYNNPIRAIITQHEKAVRIKGEKAAEYQKFLAEFNALAEKSAKKVIRRFPPETCFILTTPNPDDTYANLMYNAYMEYFKTRRHTGITPAADKRCPKCGSNDISSGHSHLTCSSCMHSEYENAAMARLSSISQNVTILHDDHAPDVADEPVEIVLQEPKHDPALLIGIDIGTGGSTIAVSSLDGEFQKTYHHPAITAAAAKRKNRIASNIMDLHRINMAFINSIRPHLKKLVKKLVHDTPPNATFIVGMPHRVYKSKTVTPMAGEVHRLLCDMVHDAKTQDESGSSITCPSCGHRDKASRKDDNTFECTSCGYTHENDDIMAAMNIAAEYGRI